MIGRAVRRQPAHEFGLIHSFRNSHEFRDKDGETNRCRKAARELEIDRREDAEYAEFSYGIISFSAYYAFPFSG